MKPYLFVLPFLFLLMYCKKAEKPISTPSSLGSANFEVSGSKEARKHFQEGLLLLHSFEFRDAAKQFVKAQDLDSNFVMAYWGEAMSFNHPLWKERFTNKGLRALEKLAPNKAERLAKAQTELEREFLEGVEILYEDGEKEALDVAYMEHMKKLYLKYPEHHEVSAFYALSLLGASKGRKKDDHYEKGAKIVQGIIDENPNHPGALHYLIHSYDDPEHASFALDAAKSYAKVAPDAGHALHMPSHIFIAMGMWDEVINSNIASYEASVDRMKKYDLDNDARGYHAFKWLMYGYLQKGNEEEARKLVYDMKRFCEETPSSKARAHYIMMKGDYLVETGHWKDSLATETVNLDQLNLMVRGVQVFTEGMAAYHDGDKKRLQKSIVELNEMTEEAEAKMIMGSPKMCSGVSRYLQPPTIKEVKAVGVLKCELKASFALMNKDQQAAEKWMKEATSIEEEAQFNFGPPQIIKPSFEMYGEWLVSQGRNKEAQKQFEKVLDRAPKRRLALMGLEKAQARN